MPRLSLAERHQALGMLEAGASQQDVAARFQCHRNTVSRLLSRHRESVEVSDRPRSGRPRVTTPGEDRWIVVTHLRNRRQTAVDTSQSLPDGRQIHPNTVRNRLRGAGLRARRPAIRPILTQRHRTARLEWCRHHIRYPLRWWNNVMFTDESRFNISGSDGRLRVYRRQNERYAQCCVEERNRYGGGSVMVWAGITTLDRTDLIIIDGNLNGERYRDEILSSVVVPFLERQEPGIIFQQDNARPHTARIVRSYLDENEVVVLPWPANSPDLSPIEHVWDEMERRLRLLPQRSSNVQELARNLRTVWNDIPQSFHGHLIASMRRRCTAVIDAHGGHTRY